MPPYKGHEMGKDKLQYVIKWCQEVGVKILTVFAFSTDNFKRPKEEVEHLMSLFEQDLRRMAEDERINEKEVKVKVIGQIDLLPEGVRRAARDVMEKTKNYDKYYFNIAIGYGGREEIVTAIRKIGEDIKKGKLSPEEILRFWSLLTPEQKAGFIEKKMGLDTSIDGIPTTIRDGIAATDSLFDRFAGLYHAFGQLEKHVATALDEDRPEEVVARVMGAKYDSLPTLLQRLWEQEDADPVQRYLTFLCASQIWQELKSNHREFVREYGHAADALHGWLAKLPELRDQLPFEDNDERRDFLEWYESSFVRRARAPEESA